VTAAVEHVTPGGPRVAHWSGSPPPLRVVSVPPLECVDHEPPPEPPPSLAALARAADIDPEWLRETCRRIARHHPDLTRDELITESLCLRWWQAFHRGGGPGRAHVGAGRTVVEHMIALARRVEGSNGRYYSPEGWAREQERQARRGHRYAPV
jgi:hypothetical protein